MNTLQLIPSPTNHPHNYNTVTSSVSLLVVGAVKDKLFKVVIVGGGVAGLFLTHCVEEAGIDYVMLKKGLKAYKVLPIVVIQ